MQDDEDKIIAYLEEVGAITWDGMDGEEAIFKFDMPKLKEVMPGLYNQIMEELDQDLLKLYESGMLDIEYNEKLEASFKLSEQGIAYLESLGYPPLQD